MKLIWPVSINFGELVNKKGSFGTQNLAKLLTKFRGIIWRNLAKFRPWFGYLELSRVVNPGARCFKRRENPRNREMIRERDKWRSILNKFHLGIIACNIYLCVEAGWPWDVSYARAGFSKKLYLLVHGHWRPDFDCLRTWNWSKVLSWESPTGHTGPSVRWEVVPIILNSGGM